MTEQNIHSDYDVETDEYVRHGMNVLQAYMFDDDEVKHCRHLYDVVQPSDGAFMVDMGCGTGELACIWKELNPSLRPIGVTNSKVQIEYVRSKQVDSILSDYHQVPLPDQCADLVTFFESFGYGDGPRLMREAFRLLRPGGRLFFKDLFAPETCFLDMWEYTLHDLTSVKEMAKQAGLECIMEQTFPSIHTAWARYLKLFRDSPLMRTMHGDNPFVGPQPGFSAMLMFRRPI